MDDTQNDIHDELPPDYISENEAKSALYLCDCPDNSSHIEPLAHQIWCDYRFWYLSEQSQRVIDKIKRG